MKPETRTVEITAIKDHGPDGDDRRSYCITFAGPFGDPDRFDLSQLGEDVTWFFFLKDDLMISATRLDVRVGDQVEI